MFCPFPGQRPIATSGSTAQESVSNWDLENVGGVDECLFTLPLQALLVLCWPF